MKKKIKPMPRFRNERDEREFWRTHDTTDYIDFSKSNRVELVLNELENLPFPSLAKRGYEKIPL